MCCRMLSTILIATLVVDLIVRLTVVLVAGLIVVLTGFLVAIPGNPGSNLYSNPGSNPHSRRCSGCCLLWVSASPAYLRPLVETTYRCGIMCILGAVEIDS